MASIRKLEVVGRGLCLAGALFGCAGDPVPRGSSHPADPSAASMPDPGPPTVFDQAPAPPAPSPGDPHAHHHGRGATNDAGGAGGEGSGGPAHEKHH